MKKKRVWEIKRHSLCMEGKKQSTESVGLVEELEDFFKYCRDKGYTELTYRGMMVPKCDSRSYSFTVHEVEFLS